MALGFIAAGRTFPAVAGLRGVSPQRWDDHVLELSRKVWLNGGEKSPEVFEKTASLVSIFPEEAFSRESSVLLTFSHRATLTVGFGFVAAANPPWGQQVTPALTLQQARYGTSLLLLEVLCTPGVDDL